MGRFRSPLFLLAILSTTLVACGGGSDQGGGRPDALLEEATLQGIESGSINFSLGVDASGSEGGKLNVSLFGSFHGEGPSTLPQLAMTAKAKGELRGKRIDFNGGLTLLPNTAYVHYAGTEYKIDPGTYAFIEGTLKQAQREAGADGTPACQEELGKLKIADFLKGDRNEGSADVGGVSTTKVSGDFDVTGAIDALLETVEGEACRSQLSAVGPLPLQNEIEKAKGEVGKAVKSAHVTVYVGDDDIVRRISAQLNVEPQNIGSGPTKAAVELDLKLTGVNEEQKISAPANAEPLNKLLVKLGVDQFELLEVLQGEGSSEGLGELLEGLAEPDDK